MNARIFGRTALVFCMIISLTSCETLVTQQNLKLSKGSTIEEFKKEVSRIDEVVEVPKASAKHQASLVVYVTKIQGADTEEIYYYAFRDGKLLYWGYPYQFSRSENTVIRDIGEEL